jgi:hypothetical protein
MRRRDQEARADHAHVNRRAAVDAGRLPCVMGQGMQESGNHGCNLQRSARHCGHALGASRMHRSADRVHHRALAARRALDPRRALSAPRHRASAQRDHQAGNGLREENGMKPRGRPSGRMDGFSSTIWTAALPDIDAPATKDHDHDTLTALHCNDPRADRGCARAIRGATP